MSRKENQRVGMVVASFLGAFFVCLVMAINDDTYGVVVSKGQNKVAFKRINKHDNKVRVIQFEDVANGMEYYNNVKVGDTLRMVGINEKDLVYGNSYGMLNASRIKTVNGKTLEEIKEIAKRDILLKQINMSNKKVR